MARKTPDPSWYAPPKATDACVLCGREAPNMTDHHLVPKSQGRRQGVKLGDIPTVRMCAACQGYLQKTFSNSELAGELNTVEAMLEREDIQRFVAWVRKQPLTKGVRVHESICQEGCSLLNEPSE